MKLPRIRSVLLTLLVAFALFYAVGVVVVATSDETAPPPVGPPASVETVAIFGASGTAGDGILKAALASPHIDKIHVITRRETPRIAEGVASGKVVMTIHMDYLDYAAIHEQIANVDAVYWAIGLSSLGVEEDWYRTIHVDFPRRFVDAWLDVSARPAVSFHYISSSDISEDSRAMWARVKVEAEKELFRIGEGTHMRVIAYRPDYIGPTQEEAHLGQKILYGFFKPVGAAVKARQIGQAMLEVSLRGEEFGNGDKLGTWKIIRYSDAYEKR